jgi:hypothetical protein
MTTVLPAAPDFLIDQRFSRALRGYVDRVANALGVGPESCTVDVTPPPDTVVRFLEDLRAQPDRPGSHEPPAHPAGRHDDLAAELAQTARP